MGHRGTPPRSVMRWGVIALLSSLVFSVHGRGVGHKSLSPKERLGKLILFDKNLSVNKNQSCVACHGEAVGWTGPDEMVNKKGGVYEGSIPHRFGNRKPPSIAYAGFSPILGVDKSGAFKGGSFWDGRATGEKLGNTAADQAQGPFMNPLEQGLADSACLVRRVCTGRYGSLFRSEWDDVSCGITWPADTGKVCGLPGGKVKLDPVQRKETDQAYGRIAIAIAAFEMSPEVNPFTSKFDYHLKGEAKLTPTEKAGLDLFRGKAKCANCHVLSDDPQAHAALFTDFSYDNLGVPRNPENPFYQEAEVNPLGQNWVDLGLGGCLADPNCLAKTHPDWTAQAEANKGKQKVPTLRNVDQRPSQGFVKAYAHNGYFKSLKEVVHFYNTRDLLPRCKAGDPGEKVSCWPAPEYPANVNRAELGNLGLTGAEEDAIVSFLSTLSDGYKP